MKMMRSLVWIGCGLVLACTTVASGQGVSVSEAIGALKSTDETVRVEAIDRLGHFGAKAAEAVPALVELLQDSSAAVRAHAARSLGKIGPAAKSAMPALAKLAGDPEKSVRGAVVTAIGAIHPDPNVAVPVLVKIIRDAEPAVRIRALRSLVSLGKPAALELGKMLEDDSLEYWAELGLAELGPEAKEAVPALVKELNDAHPESRRESILALAAMGPNASEAVGALTKALDDPMVRGAAAYALGRIGEAAKPAESKLQALSAEDNPLLKTVTIWALARIHPEDQARKVEATKLLASALTNKEQRVRVAAARALADLRPGPAISMPAIRDALKGASDEQVTDALDALATLGEAAVPGLINALEHEQAQGRVAYILGRIGPAASAAVPALAKLVQSKDADIQREAIFALAKIGPASAPAVPKLIEVYQSGTPEVRYGAAFALGNIGPGAASAEPTLVKGLDESDTLVALVSAWALAHIDPKSGASAKAIELLAQALGDPDARFRREAASALGCYGPQAKSAAAALKKATEDEDPSVREAAAEALKAIGQ